MPLQHQVMGYDRVASMFSPDGRLLQVEYAEKMVKKGFASMGLICSDGVIVVATKRPFDKLTLPETVKIFQIDSHIAATGSGMLSDARVLIDRAQLNAQQHHITYNEAIDVESIVKEVADLKQMVTQFGGARPFGVFIIITGINPNGQRKLYVTDVAGNYTSYKAAAIGENDKEIRAELERAYRDDITTEEGLKLCMTIFKKVFKKQFDVRRIEAAFVKQSDREFTRVSLDAIKRYSK